MLILELKEISLALGDKDSKHIFQMFSKTSTNSNELLLRCKSWHSHNFLFRNLYKIFWHDYNVTCNILHIQVIIKILFFKQWCFIKLFLLIRIFIRINTFSQHQNKFINIITRNINIIIRKLKCILKRFLNFH